jgi:predicted phage baseplate assembly protein
MSPLMPQLFDDQHRYAKLVELGRSRLPGIAPRWTDFNAHDPGITLMELLAWVAEAQIYSLARMRTDERAAYAALFGIRAAGNQAATGILWSDPSDPNSPGRTFAGTIVLKKDYPIYMLGDKSIEYRPAYDVLWVPGTITRLRSVSAAGATRDLTSVNDRGGAEFLPLGDNAGPDDVLSMDFKTRSDDGIFPSPRGDASGAYWIIGIRAASAAASATAAVTQVSTVTTGAPTKSPLTATLIDGATRYAVPVVADTSQGLLSTGVLVLDLSQVAGSPQQFTLELRARGGLPRPPRLIRIEPNALPITQKRQIVQGPQALSGQPDQSIALGVSTLCFEAGKAALEVDLSDGTTPDRWSRCEHLADQGPNDKVYEFDDQLGRVTFGNGVNGRIPDANALASLTYAVCDALAGNVARNRKWTVQGIAGTFGINVDPLTGGAAAPGWIDMRRAARQKKNTDHALISATDIVEATLALPLIEVARAWVPSFPTAASQTGTIALVALRARPGGIEPAAPPETPRWLEAIRSQLAPKMPLGTRLRVTGPDYVDFTIKAQVQFERGREPAKLLPAVIEALRRRLTLIATLSSDIPREFAVPLSARDVTAWIRDVDGVVSVSQLVFVTGAGAVTELAVSTIGLPRADLVNSEFDTSVAGAGNVS